MRYIFLDTESANCFDNIYKLCEYGFVIVDDGLIVFEGSKKDVLMNPGKGRNCRFYLKGRKNRPDLILAHSEQEYKASPTFDAHYDNLKFLLTQKEAMVFFWAGENDVQAILDNCGRYKLPNIVFSSYDVQILYRKIMHPKKTPSLEKAMEELGLPSDGIVAHKPDDDAMMTLLILKTLCKKTGKTIQMLISEFPECQRDSIPAYEEMMRKHKAKVEKRILDAKEKARLKPYNDELNAMFAERVEEGYDHDLLFSISVNMKRHIDKTLSHVKQWLCKGYKIKRNLAVKYLVAYDEEDAENLKNTLDASKLIILTMEEFEREVIGA